MFAHKINISEGSLRYIPFPKHPHLLFISAVLPDKDLP